MTAFTNSLEPASDFAARKTFFTKPHTPSSSAAETAGQQPSEDAITIPTSRGDNEGLGINIPVAGNKPVEVGNSPGVDCNRVRQTADRKGHGAWVARHTNCCWA